MAALLRLLLCLCALELVRAASADALPPLPGAASFAVGFDLVEARARPLPVFAHTFTAGATWTNPQEPQRRYAVPDHVRLLSRPHVEQQCRTALFSSATDVQREAAASVGVGAHAFRLGMASESRAAAEARSAFAGGQFLGQAQLHVTCYELALYARPPAAAAADPNGDGDGDAWADLLDPLFRRALAALPPELDGKESRTQYAEFVRRYGTHYYESAVLGGAVRMATRMDDSLAYVYSAGQLQQQLSANFFFMSGGIGASGTVNETSAEFDRHSTSQISLVGGNTTAYEPPQWNGWVHTVYYDPVPVSARLAPISSLAADAAVRRNIDLTVAEYMNATAAFFCDADVCSGHGRCNGTGGCECHAGWAGVQCGSRASVLLRLRAAVGDCHSCGSEGAVSVEVRDDATGGAQTSAQCALAGGGGGHAVARGGEVSCAVAVPAATAYRVRLSIDSSDRAGLAAFEVAVDDPPFVAMRWNALGAAGHDDSFLWLDGDDSRAASAWLVHVP